MKGREEVGKLLTFIGALDGHTVVDDATVYAWGRALAGVAYVDAEDAALAHFTEPVRPGARREWVTPGAILQRAAQANRATQAEVAADVRSARGRRLVPAEWRESDPLPPEVATKLQQLRDAERAEAAGYGITAAL